MKWLVALLCLSFINVSNAQGVKTFSSQKVVQIIGDLTPDNEIKIIQGLMIHKDEPGPMVLVINSTGGLVSSGVHIIDTMEIMKTLGTRFICVVPTMAHSMAFNILTHCDERYAGSTAKFLVHKIRFTTFVGRSLTAKKLHALARQIENDDRYFDTPNAQAMHMSLKEYNKYADKETVWSAPALLKRGYLNGIAKIDVTTN